MARYAALLRGIAPAFPNMTNDKLRAVFEALGLEAVSSVLSSGNILFRSPARDVAALEDRVQRALQAELDIPGVTIIRGLSELSALVDSHPFRGLTHGPESSLTVTFLRRPAADPVELPATVGHAVRTVQYDVATRAFLAVVDNTDPAGAARYLTWVERTNGKEITTRSWLTVRRIVDRLGQG